MPRGQYDRRRASDDAQTAEVVTPVASVLDAPQPVSRRADETRRERRRRNDGDLDGMARMRLTIPRDIQEQGKREGKVFRYFLETNVPDAYQNDWDRVEGADQVVANPIAGEQDRLVLCSKYKDWHDADLAQDERQIADTERAMMAGQVEGGDGLVVPKGQVNRVSRQRGL